MATHGGRWIMEMLPNDIRQHRFRKGMRGYDTDEVDQFLEHLATNLESLLVSHQRSEEKVKALEKEMSKFKDQEDALKKAVFTVEQAMSQARETSLKEVDSLRRTAKQRAKLVVQDAELERRRLEQDLKFLKESRQNYIEQLKAFCKAQLKTLENLERPDRAQEAAHRAMMPARSVPADVAPSTPEPAPEPAPDNARPWKPERVKRSRNNTPKTELPADEEPAVAYPPPLVPDSAGDDS